MDFVFSNLEDFISGRSDGSIGGLRHNLGLDPAGIVLPDHLHKQYCIPDQYCIPKTTKLILLDSLLQEVVVTLPHLVLQIKLGPRLVIKRQKKLQAGNGNEER